MTQMKTQGGCIAEKGTLPKSIVEVPTAIPAFIGITERASNGADSLSGKPWRISSMAEFKQYFGGAPVSEFKLSVAKVAEDDEKNFLYCSNDDSDETALKVSCPKILYTLYYNMVMFFANGGGACYIVSAGTYDEGRTIDADKVEAALVALEKEREVTLVVVPEAASVSDCKEIQRKMLKHCGEMKNRFAILDVFDKNDKKPEENYIKIFRENIGENYRSYGAAYYPWLNTSVLSDRDIDGTVLTWDYNQDAPDITPLVMSNPKASQYFTTAFSEIKNGMIGVDVSSKSAVLSTDELVAKKNVLHNALSQIVSAYQCATKKVLEKLNRLSPSAAMAGLYTMVDNTRGVWKAPANISLNLVNSLTDNINNVMQEDFNVPIDGKSINVIRNFIGEGIKVWGARTLDGNSLDWRYLNVRRTVMFIEESVKNATKAYASEPNDANTWQTLKSMMDNFLRGIWKRGGLAGSTSEEAYEIHIGFGETMTDEDMLNDIMRITVLVAVARPAEFQEITFQQKMQKI